MFFTKTLSLSIKLVVLYATQRIGSVCNLVLMLSVTIQDVVRPSVVAPQGMVVKKMGQRS